MIKRTALLIMLLCLAWVDVGWAAPPEPQPADTVEDTEEDVDPDEEEEEEEEEEGKEAEEEAEEEEEEEEEEGKEAEEEAEEEEGKKEEEGKEAEEEAVEEEAVEEEEAEEEEEEEDSPIPSKEKTKNAPAIPPAADSPDKTENEKMAPRPWGWGPVKKAEPSTPEPEKAAPPEEKDPADEPKGAINRTPSWFKKGELASVGALGLLPWQNRIGSRVDIERLGPLFYIAITPTVNHTLKVGDRDLTMSFGVPLRLQLLDTRGSTTDERWGGIGEFRTQDWDTPQDFVKLVRFLKYGRKEDHFFVNFSAFSTGSVGHGTILRRYNPNLSLDVQRVSLELDAFSDYVGVQTYLNDVAHPNLVGGLIFVKPLSLVDRSSYMLRSFSVGITVLGDWDAPIVNKLDTYDVDGDGRRGEILLGGDNVQPQYHNGAVVGYGVDIETKFYKSEDKTVDLKAYVDFSFLSGQVPKPCASWKDGVDKQRCPVLFTNNPVAIVAQPTSIETEWVTSNGFSAGFLGRFTLGAERKHALRLRLELRSYEPNFLPSYFDTFYQVERVQYRTSRDPIANDPANQTKARRILERSGDGRVFGTYLEATYAFWEAFEASLGINLNTDTSDNGFYLHVGVPKNEYFSFVLTYYKSTSHAEDLFDLEKNSVFLLQGRAYILPVMSLYFGAITPFGFGDSNEFEQVFDINMGLEISFDY